MKIKNIPNFIILLIILSLVGCSSVNLQPHQQDMINKKETFYTQVSMWTEKGHIIATNHKKGSHIPVNSPVIVTNINSSVIAFNYEGTTFYLKNVEPYTKIGIVELLERTFSTKKVNLSQVNQNERNAISKGEVTMGMSKKTVIISRGFPPAHHTISLNSDSWRYWDSRFNTTVYEFTNGKVSKIIK